MLGFTLGIVACGASEPAPPISEGYGVASGDHKLLARPRPGLNAEQRLQWSVGKSFATLPWVSAPATTTSRDGLGPLFNANSCSACHRSNGQGHLPDAGPGLILKLRSTPPVADSKSPLGTQLQDRALPGLAPEGQVAWQAASQQLEGETLSYRHYYVAGEHPDTRAVSARLAPMLLGLGLIDAVDEAQIAGLADPEDKDHDGISGRANRVWSNSENRMAIGRFGWKAGQAKLREQIAHALAQDMGVRSTLFPDTLCPVDRPHCETDPELDINDKLLAAIAYYIANLATPLPAAPIADLPGAALFTQLGCDACHRPRLDAQLPAGPQSFQLFSDLLLHDMGPALADPIAEFSASGREWRTAPLWGLGLRSGNGDNSRLLHDGRAASIHEAILWHGGEARAARRAYVQLSDRQKQQVLEFLKAL